MHFGNLAPAEHDKEGMGEFVSGNVKPHHGPGAPGKEENDPDKTGEAEGEELPRSPIFSRQRVSFQ